MGDTKIAFIDPVANQLIVLIRRCDRFLDKIEKTGVPNTNAFDKVRASLILAHDFIRGVADQDAVDSIVSEFKKLDVSAHDSLREAAAILGMVKKLFAQKVTLPGDNPLPDSVKIANGKELFAILYGRSNEAAVQSHSDRPQFVFSKLSDDGSRLEKI